MGDGRVLEKTDIDRLGSPMYYRLYTGMPCGFTPSFNP
jgi:hypothetical protein